MICLIGQKEAWRRHRREKLDDLGTGARRNMLDIRGNVGENNEERRIDCVQVSFAGSHEGLNGLSKLASGPHA